MSRKVDRKKYFKAGTELVKEIQHWFLITGDSDVNISRKFGVEVSQIKRITQDALNQYKHASKSKASSR